MCTTRKKEIHQQVQTLFPLLVNIFDEKEKNKYFKTKEGKMQEKAKKGKGKNKRVKNFIILKQIEEAQKKYESMNEVAKKGCTYALWYINEIINEVKENTTKEELNGVVIDENVIQFMKNILIGKFVKYFNMNFSL